MNQPASSPMRLFALCGLAALVSWAGLNPLRAQTILEECSQEQLEASIAEARENGDGTVLINCDGVISLTSTIVLTNSLAVSSVTNVVNTTNVVTLVTNRTLVDDIVLDATGYGVTISGLTGTNATNGVRLFLVDSGVTLSLVNIRLANGRSTNGGAVYVRPNGEFHAASCVFSNNLAQGFSGADGNNAPTNSILANRGKGGASGGIGENALGGAVFNLGTASFYECAFLTNAAVGGNGGNGGLGSAGVSLGGNGGNGGRGGSALGGAIYSAGPLEITNSSFYFNFAVGGVGGDGGAGGDAAVPGLTGRGASGGSGAGAAIFSDRPTMATISASTFALNSAIGGDSAAAGSGGSRGKSGPAGSIGSGGGIANYGSNLLFNCTFFGNLAVGGTGGDGGPGSSLGGTGGSGGAAWGGNLFTGGRRRQKGLVQAINCTFSDGGAVGGTNGVGGAGAVGGKTGARGASRGGNISNSNGTVRIRNTLIAYPSAGTNVYSKLIDDGFNILSDRSFRFARGSSSTNFTANATDNQLKLGVLGRNGGVVETLELAEESPAIDFGEADATLDDAFGGVDITIGEDARAVARDSDVDAGAYESGLVLGPPRFVRHPASRTVREGGAVTFTALVKGDAPMIFQWQKGSGSDPDILGSETSRIETNGQILVTYTIEVVLESDAGDYSVVAFNNSGATTSEAATLSLVRPPEITTDLFSFTNAARVDFTLTVVAEGTPTLTYQWYRNGVRIPGAILNTLIVGSPETTADYQVIVRNDYGEAVSAVARVTIREVAPNIITQPVNVVAPVGGVATFNVVANGSAPLSYQWYFNHTNLLPGRTSPQLTLTSLQASNSGSYRVSVSNSVGRVFSSSATLTVQTAKPTITTQPANFVAQAGSTATFSVVAGGSAPFGYQWFYHTTTNFSANSPVAGGTNATLNLTNAQNANAGFYSVRVTNFLGSVTSAPASLTIQSSPPVIQTSPVSATVFSGATNTFSVVAIGSGPLLYQWYFNSNVVLGATNASFTINNAQNANAGFYHVTVTNGLGAVTSAPVTLTVSNSAPVITAQPVDLVVVDVRTPVTLSVTVVGSQPISYQWFHYGLTNDVNGTYIISTNRLASGTNSVLTVVADERDEVPAVEGFYEVSITNLFGGTISSQTLLLINGEGVP